VLAWFRDGQPGYSPPTGSRHHVPIERLQYDVLCARLLQTRDLEIVRAVLWRGQARPTGPYVEPEWLGLLRDSRLSAADRLLAWRRARDSNRIGRIDDGDFWRRFSTISETRDDANKRGTERLAGTVILRAADVLHLERDGGGFPWRVFRGKQDQERAAQLLTPLLTADNLSLRKGQFARQALQALWRTHGPEASLVKIVLDLLEATDAKELAHSADLWFALPASLMSDAAAERLRAFSRKARIPRNAATAFFVFVHTPAGRRALIKPGGWTSHFAGYLDAAFAQKGAALTTRLAALSAYPKFSAPTDGSYLTRILSSGRVRLRLSEEKLKIVRAAWPEIAEFDSYIDQ
jgi:hypothetical protein